MGKYNLMICSVLLLCVALASVQAQRFVLNATHYPLLRQIYPGLQNRGDDDLKTFSKLSVKAYFERELQAANAPKSPRTFNASLFPCIDSAGTFGTPRDVNEIRPRQVEVVGAMGDSLVA